MFVALPCSSVDSLGGDEQIQILWIYLKMYDWFSLCLPQAWQSPLPIMMKAIFFTLPTLAAGMLFTNNTSALDQLYV